LLRELSNVAPPFPNPHTHDDEAVKPGSRTGALIATTTPTPVLAAIFPETLGTETLSPFMWGLCSVGAAVVLFFLADRYIGSRLGRTVHRRQWRFVASVSCLFMAGILTRLLDQAGDLPVEATYRTTVLAASHGKYPSVVLAPFGRDRGNRKVFQRDTSFGSAEVGTPIVVTETPGILGIGRRRYLIATDPSAPAQTLSSTLKGILASSWSM
jgi:hypothetical protein